MPAWFKVLAFSFATLAFLYVSRSSFHRLRSHGFYRLFALELSAALVILNLDAWFANPFAWHQLLSWSLLALSLFLVTSGAYRYIRHPLYSSLLCLAWGAFFKSPSWLASLLALGASVFLTLTAKAEEAENRRYFGPAYRAYQAHTKMFVPFVF